MAIHHFKTMHSWLNGSCIQQCSTKFVPKAFHQRSSRQPTVEEPIISYLVNNDSIYLTDEIPKTCDIKGQPVFFKFHQIPQSLGINQQFNRELIHIKLTPGYWCSVLRRTPELVNAGTPQPDSWEAGTRRTPELVDAGTRSRTLGRPELVGRRNSSMPELAAGLLGGRNSSDAGTRRCRNPLLNRPLLSSRIPLFNQPLTSDFSLIWPVGSPYIGRAKLARTRRMEGVADDDGLHDETELTRRV